MARDRRLVYSTDADRVCARCRRAVADCDCDGGRAAPVPTGPVVVALDTRKRRGKSVTTISGVPGAAAAVTALGKELKRRCGSGGTIKAGTIEIQGDHRDTIVAVLEARGFSVRRR